MCRWLAYAGPPLYLEDLIFKPEHSLIDQSLSASSGPSRTNGDGFGIGWYGSRRTPGLYRTLRPAWNDRNGRDLSAQVRSRLFLAHVRAATGTAVQQSNCHPFRYGRWLLVHNGVVCGFERIKRELVLAVAPALYPAIEGTTDSEILLYLALTFGLQDDPIKGVARMVGFVEETGHRHGIENPLQMTLGLSDGEQLLAFRYSSQRESRNLFHSRDISALEELSPQAASLSGDACAIVSEPFGKLSEAWVAIPESTVIRVQGRKLQMQPFAGYG
jgi:glutamine amidotransferase